MIEVRTRQMSEQSWALTCRADGTLVLWVRDLLLPDDAVVELGRALQALLRSVDTFAGKPTAEAN